MIRDYKAELAAYAALVAKHPDVGWPTVPRDELSDGQPVMLTLEYRKCGTEMACNLVHDNAGTGIPLAAGVAICESHLIDWLAGRDYEFAVRHKLCGTYALSRMWVVDGQVGGRGDTRLFALCDAVEAAHERR